MCYESFAILMSQQEYDLNKDGMISYMEFEKVGNVVSLDEFL